MLFAQFKVWCKPKKLLVFGFGFSSLLWSYIIYCNIFNFEKKKLISSSYGIKTNLGKYMHSKKRQKKGNSNGTNMT